MQWANEPGDYDTVIAYTYNVGTKKFNAIATYPNKQTAELYYNALSATCRGDALVYAYSENNTHSLSYALQIWLERRGIVETLRRNNYLYSTGTFTNDEGFLYSTDNRIRKEGKMEDIKTPAASPETLARAKITAGLMGVHLTPQDLEMLATMASVADCNKFIIAKKQGTAKVELTAHQRQMIREATSMKNTAAYRDKVRLRDQVQNNINSYQRTLDVEYAKYFTLIKDLKLLEDQQTGKDLCPTIEQTLQDGWYTLHEVQPEYIVFKTGRVHCQHPDVRSMNVDLGFFYIKFTYYNGAVVVSPAEDNIQAGSYYHPHVDSGFNVCWGNGNNAYATARKTLDIALLMRTLRTLLCAYNPESPFQRLQEFDYIRNKAIYDKKNKVYVAASSVGEDSRIQVYSMISDSYTEEIGTEDSDEDGNTVYHYIYEAYVKVYEGTSLRCDDEVYIKGNNNEYVWVTDDFDWI